MLNTGITMTITIIITDLFLHAKHHAKLPALIYFSQTITTTTKNYDRK